MVFNGIFGGGPTAIPDALGVEMKIEMHVITFFMPKFQKKK